MQDSENEATIKMSKRKPAPREQSDLEESPFAPTIKPDQIPVYDLIRQSSAPADPEVTAPPVNAPAFAPAPFVRMASPGADQPTPRPGQLPNARSAEPPTAQVGAPASRAQLGADQPTPRPGQLPPAFAPAAPPVPPTFSPPPPPAFAPAAPPAFMPAPGPAAGRGDAATMIMGARGALTLAWLVVLDGPDRGRLHQLKAGMTTIGRAPGNDVVLPDNTVSSQHLKIRSDVLENGEAQHALIDLASRNGTFAGSKATYRDDNSRVYRHTLRDGDYLLVGETTLVFKCV